MVFATVLLMFVLFGLCCVLSIVVTCTFFCVFCVLGVVDCDFVFWIYVCCDITLPIVCGAPSAALEAVYMCLV